MSLYDYSSKEMKSKYMEDNIVPLRTIKKFCTRTYPTKYNPYEIIGSSPYGTVRYCTSVKNDIYAIKETIPNFAEIDMMIKFDHKNVIKLYDYTIAASYDHKEREVSSFLVMELADYNLNRRIDGNLTDIVVGMIEGINYLHYNKISHCDVKLDNFVICENEVKLIGFSSSYYGNTPPHKCQSLLYSSPELWNKYLDGNLTQVVDNKIELIDDKIDLYACDIWALGVSIVTLHGYQNDDNFMFDIKEYLKDPNTYLSFIPYFIRKFVKKMLTVNVKSRLKQFKRVLRKLYIENEKIEYEMVEYSHIYSDNFSKNIKIMLHDMKELKFDVEVAYLAIDIFYRVSFSMLKSSELMCGSMYLAVDILSTPEVDITLFKKYLISKNYTISRITSISYSIFKHLNDFVYGPGLFSLIYDLEEMKNISKLVLYPDSYVNHRKNTISYDNIVRARRLPLILL